jgi:hypothetical protein
MYTITCGANQGLCSAGIRLLEWMSGLNRFTQMKTKDSSVLKVSIHL